MLDRDCATHAGAHVNSHAAAPHGSSEEQTADLQQLLQLYKEEREQLSKDVLFYKHSCKDLKRRLRTEVSKTNLNLHINLLTLHTQPLLFIPDPTQPLPFGPGCLPQREESDLLHANQSQLQLSLHMFQPWNAYVAGSNLKCSSPCMCFSAAMPMLPCNNLKCSSLQLLQPCTTSVACSSQVIERELITCFSQPTSLMTWLSA